MSQRIAKIMRLGNLARRVFLEVGIVNAIRCIAGKRRLRNLRNRFGFDPWHAATPYWCRRYKQDAVAAANTLSPGVVVEVGCGLADIVSRIRAPVRYGMDIDEKVLAAAREIAPGIHFRNGSLENLGLLSEPHIDLLIALNWLHNIDGETIVSWLAPCIESGQVRRLLLDEMLVPSASGRTHDFGSLLARWATVEVVIEDDSAHRLVLLGSRPRIPGGSAAQEV